MRTLAGPGSPVWSVAFLPDGATLLTGGADGVIRRWNALTGAAVGSSLRGTPADPLAAYAGDHGAEIFQRLRRLSHAFGEGRPARGPDTCRIVRPQDRVAARLSVLGGAESMNIVWTPETVGKTVRARSERLYARHQDAGATHRLAGRPQGAYRFSGTRRRQDSYPLVSRSRSRK